MSARKRLSMTGWYNPIMLARTGIRVAISTVFGEFADRREAMAVANAIAAQPFDASFDYSQKAVEGQFWFDYMADTGDGWSSTFAMAQLVTQPSWPIDGQNLPRGHLLVLGGDQIYPTASVEEYDNRFLHPFEEAHRQVVASHGRGKMPDLYAVPGNHDWYDGLAAFFNLFCRRRIATPSLAGIDRKGKVIAGRQTYQTRSYFALQLPCGWWLWGTDSQIEGYIDQPQVDFFQYVASTWMEKGSKLILCMGQPNWAYVNPEAPAKQFETFSFLERLAGLALDKDGKKKEHKLKLVLSGDSHHYSRYHEGDIQYVTCGGGGAFLHPTHQLENKTFHWRYPPPGIDAGPPDSRYERSFTIANDGAAIYPTAKASRCLTWGNAGFAFKNVGLTLIYCAAYVLYNWLLDENAAIAGVKSLTAAVGGAGSFWQALGLYIELSFVSPAPTLLFLAGMGGYYYLADEPYRTWTRIGIGVVHGVAQAVTATLVTCAVLIGAPSLIHIVWPALPPGLAGAAAILLASIAAGFVSATVFGLYLVASLNGFGRHWNEAFSALRIEGHKCFMRMRIDSEGALHLYPIGLRKVPKGGGTPETLKPHLIEGPIVLR
ncbi:MAG: hypothetical protein K9G48_09705 [Reyranella sp.]|nr:hypothetical protein [Reyranella sp.]